jgi:hypothetical protein
VGEIYGIQQSGWVYEKIDMGKWFSLHYNLFSLTEIERQEADIRLCTERIALVDKQKEYLEKNIAESEKNLRELIQTRRQQWKWRKGITTGLSLTFYIYFISIHA